MFGTSIAQQSIASIRNKKLNLGGNSEIQETIKALQKEMVRLSFQPNSKAEIEEVMIKINYLRDYLRQSKQPQ
ncbi:hypothetical protein OS175_01320 [Marinicella sp. S1101]|uniref:hypothetical protein n=1 Tax=Marinicella marina TaxID=2996016 RepID=UPI002260D91D|nr:hypothetical protein [Marinicella marina]MCX7552502.1 hypothetical protein [Marinicella marina]MDJ1139378.1 hypothetical protein [Marinicella marina]